MSISIIGRHYWNTVKYKNYYSLQNDGELIDYSSYNGNNDFNFNAFNIDVVYEWRFSPGSILNIIYKNGIQDERDLNTFNFTKNFSNVLNLPQTNTFAFKFIYYLDYQKINHHKST